MDSPLLTGWQQEKAELQQEVSGLQEELVETRAEKEELESRSRALQERVRLGVKGHMIVTQHSAFVILTAPPNALPPYLSLSQLFQSISAPLALSVQQEAEQHQWRRRLREAREREARQALLLHRLHNKVSSIQQGEPPTPAAGPNWSLLAPTGPNWFKLHCPHLVQTGPLVSTTDAVMSTVCAGVGLQAAVSAPGAAAAD